jgi:hypothetical protein
MTHRARTAESSGQCAEFGAWNNVTGSGGSLIAGRPITAPWRDGNIGAMPRLARSSIDMVD